jgi:hypothetical protein
MLGRGAIEGGVTHMRSVRSALVGLGTLIILLTFVGFATFSPDAAGESRPESLANGEPAPVLLAADAGSTSGRVTAFVFANQLQAQDQPQAEVGEKADDDAVELTIALLTAEGRGPLSATTTTTLPPTTTTTTARVATTTTTRPATTTTTTTSAPPTTTAPPTTVPPNSPLSESAMRSIASLYFPAAEVDKAVLVARCESNYNPSAYNPSGPYGGLYQHALSAWEGRAASAGWAGASIYDAAANTAVSAWLVARDGWGHWPTCSRRADGQLGG